MSTNSEFDLRVTLYAGEKKVTYRYPENLSQDNYQHMSDVLENCVNSGKATGGHIEELVEFHGGDKVYVMALTEEEVMR